MHILILLSVADNLETSTTDSSFLVSPHCRVDGNVGDRAKLLIAQCLNYMNYTLPCNVWVVSFLTILFLSNYISFKFHTSLHKILTEYLLFMQKKYAEMWLVAYLEAAE